MKGQNQVGVAAESRTVDRGDVEKVASVDKIGCQGSKGVTQKTESKGAISVSS